MNGQIIYYEPKKNKNLSSLLDNVTTQNIINRSSPKVIEIVKDNLYVIENFLTDEECDKIIKKSEEIGFEIAAVTTDLNKGIINLKYRKCMRIMIDDLEGLEKLFNRMKYLLPLANEGGILSSLSERWRILKYNPGDFFGRHCDGRHSQESNKFDEYSVFTSHIYLNDGSEVDGGATTFFNKRFFESGKLDVEPKKGSVAIFRQNHFEHCGSAVNKGVKYTIRHDIMYRKLNDEEKSKGKNYVFENLNCKFCGENVKLAIAECKELLPLCKCGNKFYEEGKFTCVSCFEKSSF